MNVPLISIIVPVYNAQKYLSRCLESILNQTEKNWECIIVDDGSTDRSREICEEYILKDQRFMTIHQANGGVSSARQVGLERAKGEFVIHADSDDFIDPYMFETLISYQRETMSDLVIFDFYKIIGDKKERVIQQPNSLDNKQVLSDIISGHIYASCWNKLIKRSLVAQYGTTFPKGINLGEDKCFWVDLLRNPVNVAYLSKPLYYYDITINDNSLVRSITLKSIESGIKMVGYLENLLGGDCKKELDQVKIRLKLRALQSQMLDAVKVRELYAEINKELVKDILRFKRCSVEEFALFLTILRLPMFGRALLKLRSYI